MPVAIPNYAYTYFRKGKPIFAPTTVGKRIGTEVKEAIEGTYSFDPIYFHLRKGGHVAAIHYHREDEFFARIDISNFFYSISRRRVQSALDRIGLPNVGFYAKWSTVANPFKDPRYALPYGFVQSPILASLVVATSKVGECLTTGLSKSVRAAVYVDDISLSSNNEGDLWEAYNVVQDTLKYDGFAVATKKLRSPAQKIDIFNCDMSRGRANVTSSRIESFYATNPDASASTAFDSYCRSVEAGNV